MPKVKKEDRFQWNDQYDQKLKDIVDVTNINTPKAWANIASAMKSELIEYALKIYPSGKQCRERWKNKVDPGVSRTPFTEEQLGTIEKRIDELKANSVKNPYAIVGKELKHPANQVKNTYHHKIKKKKVTRKATTPVTEEEIDVVNITPQVAVVDNSATLFSSSNKDKHDAVFEPQVPSSLSNTPVHSPLDNDSLLPDLDISNINFHLMPEEEAFFTSSQVNNLFVNEDKVEEPIPYPLQSTNGAHDCFYSGFRELMARNGFFALPVEQKNPNDVIFEEPSFQQYGSQANT